MQITDSKVYTNVEQQSKAIERAKIILEEWTMQLRECIEKYENYVIHLKVGVPEETLANSGIEKRVEKLVEALYDKLDTIRHVYSLKIERPAKQAKEGRD